MTDHLTRVREQVARALFIASDHPEYADAMAKAWDAPGSHGKQRWYDYADAALCAVGDACHAPQLTEQAVAGIIWDYIVERQGLIITHTRETVRQPARAILALMVEGEGDG